MNIKKELRKIRKAIRIKWRCWRLGHRYEYRMEENPLEYWEECLRCSKQREA